MHPLKRFGAAVFALALLIGIPYVLLWHATWPDTLPSWDVALAHLRGRRLPPGVPAAVLITALWALWGVFALSLAAEAAARLRGVPLRLRPFGPLQTIAAAAVAATALTPAAAFADTVAEQGGGPKEQGQDREEGVPAVPRGGQEQGAVERTRTVSGFAVGSAELTERMREDLAPTVDMLGDHWDEDVPVTITGHTDPSGDADRNRELSRERAQAVADYLEGELGEDAPDTEVRGLGSDRPVEGPAESQRRVEIAYTLAPAPAPDPRPEEGGQDAPEGDDRILTTVENTAAADEDGPRVVVLEIPDGAVAGVVGFAGLAGGYLLGKRGSFVPRMALSLPRRRLTRGPHRLALPPVPPRPEPEDEIDERVTVELDHVPGLGLTGKGADGAARRLIANALDPDEPLAVRILITDDEAVRLLGETGRDLLRDRPCEPVTLVPGTEDALAALAAELHTVDDGDRAPLALVISAPDARHEHALSGLLLHGQHRGVTAVILGSWPLGGNCTVDEDGLISQTSQPLATLFHCSWPGSTAQEVHEAVHAHHAAGHSGEERPPRGRPSTGRRPVLVAEDWDDDGAFARVGDAAAWERLTRAWEEDAFGPLTGPDPAAGDGTAVDAAFRALREGAYADTGTVPGHPERTGTGNGAGRDGAAGTAPAGNGTFDDAPAEPEAPTAQEDAPTALNDDGGTRDPGADTPIARTPRPVPPAEPGRDGAPGSARSTGPDPEEAGEAEAAAPPRSPGPEAPGAPAPGEEKRTRVRRERAPGRKAGRVRVVRVDHPGEPGPAPVPAPGTRPAPTAASTRADGGPAVRDRAQPHDPDPAPAQGEAAPAYRPQPARPRKAGRGRAWKPRGEG